jgi:hypothetical protein
VINFFLTSILSEFLLKRLLKKTQFKRCIESGAVHALLINISGEKKISDVKRTWTQTNLGKLKLLSKRDYPLFSSTFLFTVKNAHSAVIFGRNVIVRFRQMNSKVPTPTTYRERDKA